MESDKRLDTFEDRLGELEDLFHGNPRKGVTGMRQILEETHEATKRVETKQDTITHEREIEKAETRGTRRVINGVVIGVIIQIVATGIMAWQALGG